MSVPNKSDAVATAKTATTTTITKTGSISTSLRLRSYKELIVEQHERILLIKFDRAATKNSLNRRAYYELIRVLNEATLDAAITIVVITGGGGSEGSGGGGVGTLGLGDAFSAGNDLTQMKNYADPAHFFRGANFILRRLVAAFVYFPKVLVALVNGPCIGIGFALSALCDVVYATRTARFEAPFTRLGLCPEAGSSYTLPLALGRIKSSEMLLFGAALTAPEALQFGFVARLFADNEEVESRLWPQLLEWSHLPRESLLVSKKLLRTRERQELQRVVLAECVELEPLRYGETYLQSLDDFWQRKTNKSKL